MEIQLQNGGQTEISVFVLKKFREENDLSELNWLLLKLFFTKLGCLVNCPYKTKLNQFKTDYSEIYQHLNSIFKNTKQV